MERRSRVPEIILGCLLTVAVFSAGLLFGSRVDPAAASASAGSASWLTRDAAGFFAFIAALIAGGQAFMFWRQLRYMSEGMVDAAKAADAAAAQARTISITERPYLFVLPLNEPSPFDYRVCYHIRNYGRTPAIILKVRIGLRLISDLNVSPDYSSLLSGNTRMVIAPEVSPDKSQKPSAYNKTKPFTDADLAAVERGDAKLCLIGLIEYTSIQNDILKTGFCFEYLKGTESWNIAGDERFNFNT